MRLARLAFIGARTDGDPTPDRFVEPPRRSYEEDDPSRHGSVGAHFEVDATEIAAVAAEVRAGLSDAEIPPDFTPLPMEVVVGIVREMVRCRPTGDMPDVTFRFRANGTRLPDDFFGDRAGDLGSDTFLTVAPTRFEPVYPSYSPHTPSSTSRRENESGLRDCQLEDARALAEWFVGPVEDWRGAKLQRCWRAHTPWPEPLDGGVEPRRLDPSVVRRVVRAVREEVEHPSYLARERPWLIFDVSVEGGGDCSGSWYPMTERHWGRPRDTYLKVRLPMRPDGKPDDDPERIEEIEGLLGRVAVAGDGRVVYPALDSLDPPDAF